MQGSRRRSIRPLTRVVCRYKHTHDGIQNTLAAMRASTFKRIDRFGITSGIVLLPLSSPAVDFCFRKSFSRDIKRKRLFQWRSNRMFLCYELWSWKIRKERINTRWELHIYIYSLNRVNGDTPDIYLWKSIFWKKIDRYYSIAEIKFSCEKHHRRAKQRNSPEAFFAILKLCRRQSDIFVKG